MNIILLDTNIVSFLHKGDSRAEEYRLYLQGQRLAISFMTAAELYQWAAIRGWGERRKKQLEETFRTDYTVLAFNIEICRKWGEIRATRRALGKPISPQDAWIAATALHYNLPLVTHTPTDFEDIEELEVITTAS
jgi:tRNA(fMet)-specific endonuclease VapC